MCKCLAKSHMALYGAHLVFTWIFWPGFPMIGISSLMEPLFFAAVDTKAVLVVDKLCYFRIYVKIYTHTF
jgi:hypothetical protein